MTELPSKWRAHGAFRPAQSCLGLLPGDGIHLCLSSASPGVVAGVIADIAVAVASNVIDCPLLAKPGVNRRSPAGFAGSRANLAPASVAILSASSSMDFDAAIHAAALVRGITRPLEIAWSRMETGSITKQEDASRRLVEISDHFNAPLGLIVIIDDFAGERVADAPMWRALLNLATNRPAPILVVTTNAPAEIEDDTVVLRLEDRALSVDNPATGAPFTVAIEREGVELGAEPVTVIHLGPRRAYAPPVRAAATEPVRPVEPATKKPLTVERIYLVQTGRQLEPHEVSQFGDLRWTSDYLAAVKWAGQTIEDTAEIVVVPSDRDYRREAASAVAQRVQSQILTAGLGDKVSVRVAPAMRIAA